MSWAPEVQVEGKWSGNALRFATEEEALQYGRDLLMRWFVPTDYRAVTSGDPANYRILPGGRIEAIPPVVFKVEPAMPTDTEIDREGMAMREGRIGRILDDELDLH